MDKNQWCCYLNPCRKNCLIGYKRGYQVESASVRFIVAWKPKDEPKGADETAVLLPDIVLKRETVSEN